MKIEVKSKNYEIYNMQDNLSLYSNELNDEIACVLFSAKLKKVALARDINKNQLEQLLKEFNSSSLLEKNLIQVKFIGGDESAESKKYLASFIKDLKDIDNDADVINIVALDTCHRFHPNSFEVNGYHGNITSIEN